MQNSDSLKIRRAVIADIHPIAELQIHAWQATYCNEPIDTGILSVFAQTLGKRWLSKLQSGYELLVLETQSRIMGFISLLLNTDMEDAALIDALHVDPPAWRQGFGKRLCQAALDEIKKNGFKSARTWLFEGNQQMQMFYQSMGFSSTPIYKTNDLGEGIASKEIQYTTCFEIYSPRLAAGTVVMGACQGGAYPP